MNIYLLASYRKCPGRWLDLNPVLRRAQIILLHILHVNIILLVILVLFLLNLTLPVMHLVFEVLNAAISVLVAREVHGQSGRYTLYRILNILKRLRRHSARVVDRVNHLAPQREVVRLCLAWWTNVRTDCTCNVACRIAAPRTTARLLLLTLLARGCSHDQLRLVVLFVLLRNLILSFTELQFKRAV